MSRRFWRPRHVGQCLLVAVILAYVAERPSKVLPTAMARGRGTGTNAAAVALRRNVGSEDLVLVMNKMCPFAQRAWLALEESGLGYQLREVGLGDGLVYDLNPKGLVPVLVDDAAQITVESEDIVDRIVELSDVALSSTSPEEAERSAACRRIVNSKILPAGKRAKLFGQSSELSVALKDLDDSLVGPYMAGDKLGAADVSVAPMLQRLFESNMVSEEHSKIHQWWSGVSQRPAFRKTKLARGSYWWWW